MKRFDAGTALLGLALSTPVWAADRAKAPAENPPPAGSESPTETAAQAPVAAENVERCVRLHEQARLSRVSEKWFEAQQALTLCADATCPLAIRSDCATWLDELERALPTILIVVERDDDDREPVSVELDGRPLELPDKLAPIQLSPGTHRLRFTLPPHPPIERVVELEQGEKNRIVRVRFTRPLPPPAPAPAAGTEAPALSPARPVPVSTYLLAGGALAAFATSGALLVSALTSLESARERCAPACRAGERDSIDARLLAADLAGATGLVLGGFAVYTFIDRPTVLQREADAASRPRLSAGVGLKGRL